MHVSRLGYMRVIGSFVALAMMLCAVPASAAPSTGAQIQTAQQQADAARKRMDEMQVQLAAGISGYDAAAKNLSATRSRIAKNTRRLSELDKSMKVGQSRLSGRAAFQYRTGTPGILDVLLGAASFEEFANRLYVMSTIASQDAVLLVRLKKERAEAMGLRSDLAAQESAQVAQRDKVDSRRAGVQKQVDAQERYLDSLSTEVNTLMAAQERERAAAATAKVAAAAAKKTPTKFPKPSNVPVSKAGAIVMAKVEGRSGSYAVTQGQPLAYRPTGVAWSGVTTMYGNDDNGTGTASGRRFDENEFTCAHKTLPFGTRLAVSKGGKSVIVTVTDRGPFTPGRMLDLTRRSARYLGIDGVGTVKCEIVQPVR